MESHFAVINGIKFHYLKAGSGPLMLFLHGFPEYSGAWQAQMDYFKAHYTCVAPDLRGFNLSEKPLDVKDYKIPVLIEDIRSLIQALGFEKCVLVAHDWGGAVAWSFALKHPQMLNQLIILNAPHPYLFAKALQTDAAQQAASQYMLFFREPHAEAQLGADNFKLLKEKMGFHKLFKDNPEKMQAYETAWGHKDALNASLNYYRASPLMPNNTVTLNPQDFVVKVPTLVIWGMKDKALLPVLLDGLDDMVQDLTLIKMPLCTHWLAHQASDEINENISSWLNRPSYPH